MNTGKQMSCVRPQIWERSNVGSRHAFWELSCSGWARACSNGENSELVEIPDSHSRGRQADQTEDTNGPLISEDLAANWPSLWLTWTVKNTHSSRTAFRIYHRHCSVEWYIQLLKIFASFLVEIKSKTTCMISNKKLFFTENMHVISALS